MCGRYFLEPEPSDEALLRILDALNRRGEEVKMAGEIAPSDVAPVLTGGRILAMRWGFSRPDGRGLVINARAETAAERPMFRRAFAAARCLIPASGYFEWDADKRRYAFTRPDGPVYMAGLWRREAAEARARFVILTRAASPEALAVHDRMPVLLTGEARRAWLETAEPADVLARAEGEVRKALG